MLIFALPVLFSSSLNKYYTEQGDENILCSNYIFKLVYENKSGKNYQLSSTKVFYAELYATEVNLFAI